MQKEAKFWNSVAEKYAKSKIANEDAYNYTLERTRSYLTKNDEVLEIGCGTGSTALLLANSVKELTASDVSGEMIRIGKEKAKKEGIDNIRFIEAEVLDKSLDATQQGTAQFDAVLAYNILHLLKELPKSLEQINKRVKPGGYFISKTVCKPSKKMSLKFLAMMLILPVMQLVGKAPYVKIRKSEEFDELIKNAGFKVIESGNHPDNPPHRFIIAQKIK
ncbi:MAG: class I SAM-dependent methyltransferase [Rhizobiales bacterium]|nr:class I SAM-dependent methyltransferase [Hyphomicrobiales bacterium]